MPAHLVQQRAKRKINIIATVCRNTNYKMERKQSEIYFECLGAFKSPKIYNVNRFG